MTNEAPAVRPKKRIGRPLYIMIRATEHERQQLATLARKAGLTMSDYVRKSIGLPLDNVLT